MKKSFLKKYLPATVATVLAITASAFIHQGKNPCEYQQQYRHLGSGNYVPVYNEGSDYVCDAGAGICTYYKPEPVIMPNYYQPCHIGQFVDLTE